MNIDAHLRWWLAVTRVVESERPEYQHVFRLRLEGRSLDECKLALISATGKQNITRDRVRQIEERIKRRIIDSLTPPEGAKDNA